MNVTATVQLEFFASVPVQVPPLMVKSAALGPLVLLPTEIAKGDLLVTIALSILDDACETVP